MVFPTAAARDMVVKNYNAIEGGKQTLARLGEHLCAAADRGLNPPPDAIPSSETE
jgi:hypothetical protein